MEKQIGFKVVAEYECDQMISEKDFAEMYDFNPIAAYKEISDNFEDSPANFCSSEKIVSVSVLGAKTPESKLKEIAIRTLSIDHFAIQVDDQHECEAKERLLDDLDKLDRYDAVRLLMHVMHVQSLIAKGIEIGFTQNNPFANMADFNSIGRYVKNYPPKNLNV